MEKLIYALWRDPDMTREGFNERLLGEVADAVAPHVRSLRINVQDETVREGDSSFFVVTNPQMEAVAQVWIDSAFPPRRAPIEAALLEVASRIEGWLVAESMPVINTTHPAGRPTDGLSQIVFIERPEGVEHETWRQHWQNGHTDTAIETQSSFEYSQNLVVRPLTGDSVPYAAIVEEMFPLEARRNKALFYDAVGDPAKLAANEARMMASCANFIGEKGCDCIPMRQYQIK